MSIRARLKFNFFYNNCIFTLKNTHLGKLAHLSAKTQPSPPWEHAKLALNRFFSEGGKWAL